MKGSINNQANQLWKVSDGIGVSKKDSRENSGISAMSGHKMSYKIHSLRSKQEFIRISKELLTYAKTVYGIKDMQQINNQVVSTFITDKIEDGILRDSLSSYISLLQKVQINLDKMPKKIDAHNNLYSIDKLKELRVEIDKHAVSSKHVNKAYTNPNSIVSSVEGDLKIAAQLQVQNGLRVHEATRIKSNNMLGKNTIHVQGKGGFTRDVRVEPKLYKEIEKHINKYGSYNIEYRNYYNELKNAVSLNNEKWNGTHGLRYNYAQRKMAEYQREMPYRSALQKVSFELGHKRADITKHYLKAS
ncbi:hypothetical protein [Sulfurimonas sp.]|uniref:hypothetical protein n=1 Tax=Sulfurimonas sp. TaxID=2022749 RepID=UPI0035691E15